MHWRRATLDEENIPSKAYREQEIGTSYGNGSCCVVVFLLSLAAFFFLSQMSLLVLVA